MNLESAVAVITGATRGVGRGVARELARQGARVLITGRSVPGHAPFDEPITQSGAITVMTNKWTRSDCEYLLLGGSGCLAADPDVLRYSGEVVVAAALAREHGFTDLDGKSPRPLTLADV